MYNLEILMSVLSDDLTFDDGYEDELSEEELEQVDYKEKPKLSMSKKKNPTVQELEDIFYKDGYKSTKFCMYVKSLLYFIVRRYHGDPNEDLINNCYLRLFEILKDFDKSKGNLGSFIFSICRNEITKFQYKLKKQDKELSVDISSDIDRVPYDKELIEIDYDENISSYQIFEQYKFMKFSPDFIKDYLQETITHDVISKVFLWDKLSLNTTNT